MREHLRAGGAVYNAGYHHAAHDAWEDRWLDLESGTDDERLLHGLIQFTAAVHHARNRNWEGCVGLAESALEYLAGLPADFRGVDLERVRAFLAALSTDPEVIERRAPAPIVHDGTRPILTDLDPAETAIAAAVLAEELGYEKRIVERAGEYALADLEAGDESNAFLALLFDFVREGRDRDLIYRRLEAHVDRRAAKEEDVEGLF